MIVNMYYVHDKNNLKNERLYINSIYSYWNKFLQGKIFFA